MIPSSNAYGRLKLGIYLYFKHISTVLLTMLDKCKIYMKHFPKMQETHLLGGVLNSNCKTYETKYPACSAPYHVLFVGGVLKSRYRNQMVKHTLITFLTICIKAFQQIHNRQIYVNTNRSTEKASMV